MAVQRRTASPTPTAKKVLIALATLSLLLAVAAGCTQPAPTGPQVPTVAPTAAPTQTPATAAEALTAAFANQAKEYSVESKTTVVDSGKATTVQGKLYVKPNKIRLDAKIGGVDSALLFDQAAKSVYVLSTAAGQKLAIRYDFDTFVRQNQSATSAPTAMLDKLQANSKLVGTEALDGKPTSVLDYTPTGNSQSARIWIWVERGVPLKLESTTATGQATVEYANYDFAAQPDSLFALPPDAKLMDLNANTQSTPKP